MPFLSASLSVFTAFESVLTVNLYFLFLVSVGLSVIVISFCLSCLSSSLFVFNACISLDYLSVRLSLILGCLPVCLFVFTV